MYEFDTLAVIGGGESGYEDSVSPPIFQTSTFGGGKKYSYTRLSNPTREILQDELALLEGGKYAFAFASGLAAVNSVFSLLSSGDRVIISDDLYGGSYRMATRIFERFKIEFEFIDTTDAQNVENSLKNGAKMVFIESPTNPMMKISPIAEIALLCKKHNAIFVVDNTFLTPYFQNPLALGADIVLHSATKYLSGHHDTVAGAVVTSDQKIAEELTLLTSTLGNALSPFDSWLVLRGLRTLPMRMEKHQENALSAVEFLSSHAQVDFVVYPAISSNSGATPCSNQSRGFGGVLSFAVKDEISVKSLLKGGKIIKFAESLGGFRSLITHPMTQTHASVPNEKRLRLGITDKLFRLSCGLENKRDIIADLDEMLRRDC